MRTVAITEQGIYLRVKSNVFLLEKAGKKVRVLHPDKVSQFIVVGKVEISSSAIQLAMRRGIDIVFITEGGKFVGRLSSSEKYAPKTKVSQYSAYSDITRRIEIAKSFVLGKLKNQFSVIKELSHNTSEHEHKEKSREGGSSGEKEARGNSIYEEFKKSFLVLMSKLPQCSSIEDIMGIEGRASAIYFSFLPYFVENPSFSFSGRTKRPPRDRFNAVLSSAYSMLQVHVESSILLAGLDPSIGYLHEISERRPSLVFDMMEEFRPLIDKFVVDLVNSGFFSQEDFFNPFDRKIAELELSNLFSDVDERAVLSSQGAKEEEYRKAVYLKSSAWRRLIGKFLSFLRSPFRYRGKTFSLRDIMGFQAYILRRCLLERKDYEPFIYEF